MVRCYDHIHVKNGSKHRSEKSLALVLRRFCHVLKLGRPGCVHSHFRFLVLLVETRSRKAILCPERAGTWKWPSPTAQHFSSPLTPQPACQPCMSKISQLTVRNGIAVGVRQRPLQQPLRESTLVKTPAVPRGTSRPDRLTEPQTHGAQQVQGAQHHHLRLITSGSMWRRSSDTMP